MVTHSENHQVGHFRVSFVEFTVAHSPDVHYEVQVVDRRVEQLVSSRTFGDVSIANDYFLESLAYYRSLDTIARYPHILEC